MSKLQQAKGGTFFGTRCIASHDRTLHVKLTVFQEKETPTGLDNFLSAAVVSINESIRMAVEMIKSIRIIDSFMDVRRCGLLLQSIP